MTFGCPNVREDTPAEGNLHGVEEGGVVPRPLDREDWKQRKELLTRYVDTEFDNWASFRIESTSWGTIYVSIDMGPGPGVDPETYDLLDP